MSTWAIFWIGFFGAQTVTAIAAAVIKTWGPPPRQDTPTV